MIPDDIEETLLDALGALRGEIYASEPFDQKEQYERVEKAKEWIEGMQSVAKEPK